MTRNHHRRRQKRHAKERERATLAPPYQSNLDADEAYSDCACCHEEKKPTKWFGSPEWWTAISSIVLAVFSIFSFSFLFIQLDESHRALRIDQRAWVGANKLDKAKHEDLKSYIYNAEITNTGKTPASNVHIYMTSGVFPTDKFPENPPFRLENSLPSNGTIFPGVTIYAATDIASIGALNEIMVERRQASLYIYGKIEYGDVFKKQHWTHFCWQFFYEPIPDQPPNYSVSYRVCPNYNDTDADYDKETFE